MLKTKQIVDCPNGECNADVEVTVEWYELDNELCVEHPMGVLCEACGCKFDVAIDFNISLSAVWG